MAQKKAKRPRSPAYPAKSLLVAVHYLRTLYQKYDLNKIPAKNLLEAVGLSYTSGTGVRTLSALSQFGLFEVDGEGENREYWLSDVGEAILRNDATSQKAIQKAALLPDIHQWMWRQFNLKTNPLPQENLWTAALETKGFSANAMPEFMREFRETYAFAKLGIANSLNAAEDTKSETEIPEKQKPVLNAQSIQPKTGLKRYELTPRTQPDYETDELKTWLTQNKEVRLIIPKQLNKTDFQLLANWLDQLKIAALYEQEQYDSEG